MNIAAALSPKLSSLGLTVHSSQSFILWRFYLFTNWCTSELC